MLYCICTFFVSEKSSIHINKPAAICCNLISGRQSKPAVFLNGIVHRHYVLNGKHSAKSLTAFRINFPFRAARLLRMRLVSSLTCQDVPSFISMTVGPPYIRTSFPTISPTKSKFMRKPASMAFRFFTSQYTNHVFS